MAAHVSIIVPCYNDGEYLREAVSSIQQHVPSEVAAEILVSDDGSTDACTRETLEALRGSGIRVLSFSHAGPSAARNRAINVAEGEFILPLDADNRLQAAYLLQGLDILRQCAGEGVVYGDHSFVGLAEGVNQVGRFDLLKLIMGNYIDTCALFRKSLWERLGGYDEAITLGVEDWDFWLRAVKLGATFHYLRDVCFEYRLRKHSLTDRSAAHQKRDIDYMFSKEVLADFRQIRDGVLAREQVIRRSYSYRMGNFFMSKLARVSEIMSKPTALRREE